MAINVQEPTDFNWLQPDDLLSMFIKIMNNLRSGFDVTIVTNGIMLTGTIISGHEYLLAMGDVIADMKATDHEGRPFHIYNDENKEAMRNRFEEIANIRYPKTTDTEKSEDESDDPTLAYIHLKNVQALSGQVSRMNYSQFPYWRFRLSEVSGWTLGRATRD